MRPPVDEARIKDLARELGRLARQPVQVYLTGGATAVIQGWRASTVDVDLRIEPGDDELYRALPRLKESLQIKIERGFEKDVSDVRQMLCTGLVERERLRKLYDVIEPGLYRYPALDAPAFRRKLDAALHS